MKNGLGWELNFNPYFEKGGSCGRIVETSPFCADSAKSECSRKSNGLPTAKKDNVVV